MGFHIWCPLEGLFLGYVVNDSGLCYWDLMLDCVPGGIKTLILRIRMFLQHCEIF